MAVTTGPCPSCGASIEFRAGASISLVCPYCKHVVVRTDRDMQSLGRVADVTFSDAALAPGDSGTFRGRSFTVQGRLVLQHPAGGRWEEYYAIFDGRFPAWISEAQGAWQVVNAVPVPAPQLQTLAPQSRVQLGPNTFVVQERNEGTFLAAEGELPFAAVPGTRRLFVDLAGAEGRWASIDYGDGTTQPQVFIGTQTSFAELELRPRGGDRPQNQVKTANITCKSCGAPLPVLSPGSARAACRHCNAVTDVELQQVVQRQEKARQEPSIELGRRGVLTVSDAKGIVGAEWIVLGYVERSTGEPGSDDWFGWQEYLLYNVQHGYRWLVYDEGDFIYVTPLSAGDLDTSRAPAFIRYRNLHFKRRNSNIARVDHVVGEFYWKVSAGETVRAEDFVHGPEVLSCESSDSEANWSYGIKIPTALVTTAFGYQPKASAYGAKEAASGGSKAGAIIFIALILVFIFAIDACTSCDGSSSSSGVGGIRTGGSSGGFGGK